MRIMVSSEMSETPRHHCITPSPLGRLLLVGERGVLVGLYTSEASWNACAGEIGEERRDPGLLVVVAQLAEYFAGQRTTFDVPFELHVSDTLAHREPQDVFLTL